MPSVPSLPNGISDALKSPSMSLQHGKNSGGPSTLRCIDVTVCYSDPNRYECMNSDPCTRIPTPISESTKEMRPFSRLAALADAAAMFSDKTQPTSLALPSGSCCAKQSITRSSTIQNLDLPPILADPSGLPSRVPDFPVMPPLAAIKSIAGSGCTCGLHCACPGCTEHRPPMYVSKDRRGCMDGCGDCVDYSSGVALPGLDQGGSLVDAFFGSERPYPSVGGSRGLQTEDSIR